MFAASCEAESRDLQVALDNLRAHLASLSFGRGPETPSVASKKASSKKKACAPSSRS